MEQNLSCEANSHSAGQEIPLLLWNSEIYYRVHKSPFPRPSVTFRNKLFFFFYGEESLGPCPTPKMEDHTLSDVSDYLFNVLSAIAGTKPLYRTLSIA